MILFRSPLAPLPRQHPLAAQASDPDEISPNHLPLRIELD
jgi:hypothetical protein